jgi:phage-related minor tail protein
MAGLAYGPRDVRMGAVGQLIGAVAPGGSIARIAEAIKTGDVNKLSPDLGLVSLQNLGIKTPSVEAIVRDLGIAAGQVKEIATTAIAMAGNAVKSVVNTVQDILGNSRPETGVAGGESYTPSYSGEEVSVFNGDSLYPNALGGAFNKGVKMFATGGAFSNSIVSNPTMFPLGVMGEAGPEAIMPLKRMGDGSLGVTAEVPVNYKNNQTDAALLSEVKKLRQEIQGLRTEARVSAVGTNKTFRLLERVTRNGESMQVVDVTPV